MFKIIIYLMAVFVPTFALSFSKSFGNSFGETLGNKLGNFLGNIIIETFEKNPSQLPTTEVFSGGLN